MNSRYNEPSLPRSYFVTRKRGFVITEVICLNYVTCGTKYPFVITKQIIISDLIITGVHCLRLYTNFVSFLEAINTNNYTYTIGSDRDNTFLFCNTNDTSIQLSNIYWRRKDVIGFYSNPLDVYSLRNILIGTNDHIMECYDFESDNNILSIGLFIQGKIANVTLFSYYCRSHLMSYRLIK